MTDAERERAAEWDAIYALAQAAGNLVLATDSMDHLRAERISVLNALRDVDKTFAAHLKDPHP